jgi:hypothetical protein
MMYCVLCVCPSPRLSLAAGSDKHEGVYLVCKIERVLQGDPDEDSDLYLKPKQRTEGETKALSKKVKAAAIHLSDFRQPFAWGMQQLFTDTVCAVVLCCVVVWRGVVWCGVVWCGRRGEKQGTAALSFHFFFSHQN